MKRLTRIQIGKYIEYVASEDVEKYEKRYGDKWFDDVEAWDSFCRCRRYRQDQGEVDKQIVMSYQLQFSEEEKLNCFREVHHCSAGTFCNLTGMNRYDDIEAFLNYCFVHLDSIPSITFTGNTFQNIKMLYDWYLEQVSEPAIAEKI